MRCCSRGRSELDSNVNRLPLGIFLCSISSYDSTLENLNRSLGTLSVVGGLKFDDFSVKCLFVLFFLPLMMFALSIYEIVRDSREEWRLDSCSGHVRGSLWAAASQSRTRNIIFNLTSVVFRSIFFYICWFTRKRLFKQKREKQKRQKKDPNYLDIHQELRVIVKRPRSLSRPHLHHSVRIHNWVCSLFLWVSLSFSAFFYRKLFSSLWVFLFLDTELEEEMSNLDKRASILFFIYFWAISFDLHTGGGGRSELHSERWVFWESFSLHKTTNTLCYTCMCSFLCRLAR